jgi:hypothetical protein
MRTKKRERTFSSVLKHEVRLNHCARRKRRGEREFRETEEFEINKQVKI